MTLADISWRQIKDMRNQLINNYGKRRKETIWGVITEDAPMIYAYTTPDVTYHESRIKIGYTERDVELGKSQSAAAR